MMICCTMSNNHNELDTPKSPVPPNQTTYIKNLSIFPAVKTFYLKYNTSKSRKSGAKSGNPIPLATACLARISSKWGDCNSPKQATTDHILWKKSEQPSCWKKCSAWIFHESWQFVLTYSGWWTRAFKVTYRGWKGHEFNHLEAFFINKNSQLWGCWMSR